MNLVHLPYATYTNDACGNTLGHNDWRYDEGTLVDAPGIVGHVSAYGTGFTTRGNVTSSYGWLSGNNFLIKNRSQFDIAGNAATSFNTDGQNTTYSYNNDGLNLYAFPTRTVDALGNATTANYDYNAGQPSSVTDAANKTTTYSYADPFNRPLQVVEPTGAQTNMSYPNSGSPNVTAAYHDKATAGDRASLSSTVTDGLGRIYERRTLTDSGHYIVTDQIFDAAGRVSQTANPSLYTISPWQSDGLNYATTYGYDSLGRVTSVKTPDGQTTTTTYSGNSTKVVDPTNRAVNTVVDALGRVTFVFEDANGSNLQTQNTYNAAGSLTNVLKCSAANCSSGQSRSFSYDALQRLTQAANPESGTYTYSYTDGNGVSRIAPQKRTDARGNTTIYGYDSMARLTSMTYNDGTPNASYSYGPTNLLTQSKNGNVTNNYTAFDGNGRVTASNVQMQGQTFNFGYQYDLNGDLTQETYPSGRVLNTSYDIAKRPQTENGVAGGTTTAYVQSAGYFPDGQSQFWQYGSNLWSWQSVDKMLRPWQAWATQNNNGNNWMFYAYYGFDNNSSVISANEGFGPGVPWNSMTFMNDQYEYDGLKRLTKVTDTNYLRQYSWDEYGNLALSQNSGVPLSGLTPYNNGTNPFNTANNHLPGTNYGYDAREMMTKLGAVTMGFDAEGNMKSTNDSGTGQNVTWIYDAEGQRTQK